MRTLKLIIWGVISLYFQILISPKLVIGGIMPNILLAYLIFVSINLSSTPALLISFFVGLIVDVLQPSMFGAYTSIFIIISFIIIQFHMNLDKTQILLVLLSIVLINFIYSFLISLFYFFQTEFTLNLFLNTFFAFLYNSGFSLVFLYLFVLIDKLKIGFHD
ncbi:MAG: rod shape-determining protein MreD [Candidatus Cloacimonetes bacterium]|nr:rod shape-determining protein MreD [Candidatus Cloacimonadota bacterium]